MLKPPDSHHLSAAVGWLELGNGGEARLELDKISETLREDPDVLRVWWAVLAAVENWREALEISGRLLQKAPDDARSWLHHAYALRRAPGGGVEAAWKVLLHAAEKFPEEETIPYNLSCYACQLGEYDQARRWLRQAMRRGGREEIRNRALNDEDLKPLWWEIRHWKSGAP